MSRFLPWPTTASWLRATVGCATPLFIVSLAHRGRWRTIVVRENQSACMGGTRWVLPWFSELF